MKIYRVCWVDRVTRSVLVEANSEEHALEMVSEGEGFEWNEVVDDDVEFFEEPWIDEEQHDS